MNDTLKKDPGFGASAEINCNYTVTLFYKLEIELSAFRNSDLLVRK
jgi:hypothetical protein